MRFLPALLLIAVPLLAQEPSEEERPAQGEENTDQEKLKEEEQQYKEQSDELRRLANQRSKWGMTEEELVRHIEDLKSESEEVRAQAMEAIKRTNATLEELLPLVTEALELARKASNDFGPVAAAAPLAARTLFFDKVGAESIRGNADGTEYTLKSLGEGRYDLHATKRAADGRLMEEWKDKGTIAELQGKYAFLKAGLMVQMPELAVFAEPQAQALRAWTIEASLPNKAAYTARIATAWGGGGRVGVSVVAPSEDLRFHLQLPEGAGFIVQQVIPGSRAEQIGIRRMDILLKLDGELIDSPIQLKKLHEKTGVLEILRRSETKKIDLSTCPDPEPEAAAAAVEPAAEGAAKEPTEATPVRRPGAR